MPLGDLSATAGQVPASLVMGSKCGSETACMMLATLGHSYNVRDSNIHRLLPMLFTLHLRLFLHLVHVYVVQCMCVRTTCILAEGQSNNVPDRGVNGIVLEYKKQCPGR